MRPFSASVSSLADCGRPCLAKLALASTTAVQEGPLIVFGVGTESRGGASNQPCGGHEPTLPEPQSSKESPPEVARPTCLADSVALI